MSDVRDEQQPTNTWTFVARVIIKALLMFALCNVIFAIIYPLNWLGQFSLYGVTYPLRPRLPYGENPAASYNVSLTNLPALFATHEINRAKQDEFRVLLIGDSNTWGWLLENDETLSAQLNAASLQIEGRNANFYNLGYPVMSLTKDWLILDHALQYDPDMIIWLVSLASFPPEQQFLPPLVQENADHLPASFLQYAPETEQIETYSMDWWQERSIVGTRRQLADLLRLQTYGASWLATDIDQVIPDTIPLRQSDFDADASWSTFAVETELTTEYLAFDVLQAGIERAGDIPMIVINEPMFISDGQNSAIRYNSFYPRWAYDQYRMLMVTQAEANAWQYYDLWDTIAPEEFTDSPVHLSADGTRDFAQLLIDRVLQQED